ncbi:MAG: radical SAM protein [Proteobacteria bacterium]|nr:radical SAM protein [Pseudomonadota bacterium]MBU4469153.1 radical SAM protein [Pseudomonadota bacterium]MCG2752184.1 radical SAM protein [Desulfobacteraceae bacterium]
MEKPLIIPIFIPQAGCPHQCVFCNQGQITGKHPRIPSPSEMEDEIQAYLGFQKEKNRPKQLAFYGGNFLGLLSEDLSFLLEVSSKLTKKYDLQSIRFSTRPDSITKSRMEILKNSMVSTVEIGLQSMNDRVLEASNRGHTALDTEKAVQALRSVNVEIGLQMMVGLPEDSEEIAMDTAQKIIDLSPDFVRIYPTVVLANSVLANWYQKGKYHPLALEKCVSLVKKIFLLFNRAGIPVVRMGLQPSADLGKEGTILAGPFHPSFGHMVYSEIFLDHLTARIESFGFQNQSKLCIRVHPQDLSMARGLNNKNLRGLEQKFGTVDILPDPSVHRKWAVIHDESLEILK